MAKKNTLSPKALKTFIDSIVPPDGFSKTVSEEKSQFGGDKYTQVVITLPDNSVEFKMEFYPGSEYILASGHTTFTTSKGRRSFDRHGVEDSFYIDSNATPESVSEILTHQLEKIERHERELRIAQLFLDSREVSRSRQMARRRWKILF